MDQHQSNFHAGGGVWLRFSLPSAHGLVGQTRKKNWQLKNTSCPAGTVALVEDELAVEELEDLSVEDELDLSEDIEVFEGEVAEIVNEGEPLKK